MNKILSYTAANSMPVKLLRNQSFLDSITCHHIKPIHFQLSLTNRCNLKCDFCSCKNEERDLELDWEMLRYMVNEFAWLGAQAVTITGGGEPLLHPQINELIAECWLKNIAVGLVTNGTMLHKLSDKALSQITWCRISCSDERKFRRDLYEKVVLTTDIDWAFSYVATEHFDADNFNRYIDFANKHHFSHVRVVSNLIDLDGSPDMERVKEALTVDDSLVIYQGRKMYTQGAKNCWISLLKPIISADGNIYPCCGVQYAHEQQDLSFPESMQMGSILDSREIWQKQKRFDGSQCQRCYYESYNQFLGAMLAEIKHTQFI